MATDTMKKVPDRETTSVVSYGTKENTLVVETVGSFINMMNYINSTNTIIRFINGGVEQVPMNFEFDKSREYKLVYSQVIKIVLDGKECEKTEKELQRVLDIEKDIFSQILKDILEKSDGVGFSLSKMTGLLDTITRL